MFLNSLFRSESQQSEAIKILNVSDYRSAISSEDVQLVDVRTPNEYRSGNITNAINIDFFQPTVFAEKFSRLDKNKPVYIYCRTGARSQKAAAKLLEMGFSEVIDLRGGYMQWN
ncbi:rhodanese-like domain-containing protein [Aureitalea sp. L0-47]|uniref:rhodanese-like domain-containing protein n=1 Tax=Aureitalea sp. L0-47 TaxID=2816962 RepID=UPI002238FEB3|nr:rhodanese-like domain-containing protein [Aureitalea sp. L0-47]MCW5518836.1 rhodanese-like domain-containing protein [Aureitalea sp. L0-47]